jgi:hypothetical protein
MEITRSNYNVDIPIKKIVNTIYETNNLSFETIGRIENNLLDFINKNILSIIKTSINQTGLLQKTTIDKKKYDFIICIKNTNSNIYKLYIGYNTTQIKKKIEYKSILSYFIGVFANTQRNNTSYELHGINLV